MEIIITLRNVNTVVTVEAKTTHPAVSYRDREKYMRTAYHLNKNI
jgi:hypothetical protein